MDISPIGNGNYYIMIGNDELQERDVSELVQKNIATLSRNMLLETFAGSNEAIIFVRVSRGSPVVFSFSDFEAVISAARLCDGDSVAFLSFDATEYMLIYYPWSNEPAPAALYEFCTSTKPVHPDYQWHMEEQGQLLLGPCAIEQLQKLFG